MIITTRSAPQDFGNLLHENMAKPSFGKKILVEVKHLFTHS